jgi:uncharacterized surface protein with fasciclin (FAS1) repeats
MLTSQSFTLNRRLIIAISAAAFLSACATVEKPVSLADTLAKTPELSTLNGLVKTAGLTETLQGAGPFTIFAPNDAAFKALKAGTIEDLSKNPSKLKDLITYHGIAGNVMAKDVKNSSVKALNGDSLAVSKAGEFVTVENAMVVKADVMASNGVIHIVDTVMTPPKK